MYSEPTHKNIRPKLVWIYALMLLLFVLLYGILTGICVHNLIIFYINDMLLTSFGPQFNRLITKRTRKQQQGED